MWEWHAAAEHPAVSPAPGERPERPTTEPVGPPAAGGSEGGAVRRVVAIDDFERATREIDGPGPGPIGAPPSAAQPLSADPVGGLDADADAEPLERGEWVGLWSAALDALSLDGPTTGPLQRQMAIDRLSLLACSLEAHGGPPGPRGIDACRYVTKLDLTATCGRHLRPVLVQALQGVAAPAGLAVGEVVDAAWQLSDAQWQTAVAGVQRPGREPRSPAAKALLSAVTSLCTGAAN